MFEYYLKNLFIFIFINIKEMFWNLFGKKDKQIEKEQVKEVEEVKEQVKEEVKDKKEEVNKDNDADEQNEFFEDEIMYDYLKYQEDFDYIFNFIKNHYKKEHFNKLLINYNNYIETEKTTILNKDFIDNDIIYTMNNIVVILDSLESNKLEKYILNILYFIIDKYDGCGWRKLFEILVKIILYNELEIDLTNIIYNITTYGRYDSLYIFMGTKYEKLVINLLVDLLDIDYKNLNDNKIYELSTICKWLPKEHSTINKKHKILQKISRELLPKINDIRWNQYIYIKNSQRKNDSIYLKIFRKEIISIIREKLRIRDSDFITKKKEKYMDKDMDKEEGKNSRKKNINIYNLENNKYGEILNYYKDYDTVI